jgi:regulator of sigma E protease
VILAVMNLLPIPALDGGHILFILIEMLKGSPVRREIQERCVQFGFVGLLLLMSFVLLNDINKLWIAPLFSQ